MSKLVIFKGDAVENETRLGGRAIRLGRDPRNDIVLDDKSVSRFHAEVRPEGDRYVIVDLKSRNGVWVNGLQARGKITLALGTPVTLGAFELALEDDVATGEFDDDPSLVPGTAINGPASADQPDQASRSGTRVPTNPPRATTRRQQVMWAGAAVAILVIGAAAFAFILYRSDLPTETAQFPPPPPGPPLRLPDIPVVLTSGDPNKAATIDQLLDEAKAALGQRDYTLVLEQVSQVLELEPGNRDALDLKRRADSAVRGTNTVPETTTTTTPIDIETPGIPRRTGEAWPDYLTRVQRIDVNLKVGRSALEKQDFANALARFRLVDRDQKGYPGVDALIADAAMKQRAAFDVAMDSGQQNEQANRLREARQWYQRAAFIDPNAASAREKDVLLMNRTLPEATRLFNQASFEAKTGGTQRARRTYQQVLELTLPGDEIREKAVKELEKLK